MAINIVRNVDFKLLDRSDVTVKRKIAVTETNLRETYDREETPR